MTAKATSLISLIQAIDGIGAETKEGVAALVSFMTGEDLQPKPPEETYQLGDRFEVGQTQRVGAQYVPRVYLLAKGDTPGYVNVINVHTGGRRGPAVKVASHYNITREELERIFNFQFLCNARLIKRIYSVREIDRNRTR